jgi:hypothetical protein
MLSRFFLHPVRNEQESTKSGHPVFKDVVYLELINPGAVDDTWQRKATDQDHITYAEAWAKFRAGEADQITGWRVEQWAALSPAEVATLKSHKFYTVESIAEASDAAIQSFMGGAAMRAKAKAAIAQAADTSVAEKLATEIGDLKMENKRLNDELQALKAAVEEKRGPGRPRKVAEEA